MARVPKAPAINGILNINKPYGLTSMEVVRRLKRASRQKKVGHGGTLDPVATGVVPICFGQATRMMEYLVDGQKEYRAEIELGVTTDTYDSMGQVVDERPADGVTLEDVEATIEPYLGTVKQVPPMYSALKRQGKRLYDLARQGMRSSARRGTWRCTGRSCWTGRRRSSASTSAAGAASTCARSRTTWVRRWVAEGT